MGKCRHVNEVIIRTIIRNSGGVTGPTGMTGPTGATGQTGATGPSGPTGHDGDPGTSGTSGSIGDVGSTGSVGLPGTIGSPGDTGTAGSMGLPGSTGLIGTGGTGGTVGDDGSDGTFGETGSSGQGLTGLDGSSGQTGKTGSTGLTGEGNTGTSGPTGSTGSIGPQGPIQDFTIIESYLSAQVNTVGYAGYPALNPKYFNGWFFGSNIFGQYFTTSVPGTYLFQYNCLANVTFAVAVSSVTVTCALHNFTTNTVVANTFSGGVYTMPSYITPTSDVIMQALFPLSSTFILTLDGTEQLNLYTTINIFNCLFQDTSDQSCITIIKIA